MKYAGFWKRFMALMLDLAILVIPFYAINAAIPFVGSFLLVIFYFPIFESSSIQATPGKYWMGLKVLNENGRPLTFLRSLARFLLKYVSFALCLIGYIVQLFTAKRQTLHDILTEAVVVEHSYSASPDWIQTWMKQVRFVLRLDDEKVVDVYPTEATSQSNSSAAVEAIEKLYSLYKGGVLTEDEFQTKKAELLKQV